MPFCLQILVAIVMFVRYKRIKVTAFDYGFSGIVVYCISYLQFQSTCMVSFRMYGGFTFTIITNVITECLTSNDTTHNWLVWMYPEEFGGPVKQKVFAQAKGYAYVCKQLLLLGVCNVHVFLWRSFCLEAFARFYAYSPLSTEHDQSLILILRLNFKLVYIRRYIPFKYEVCGDTIYTKSLQSRVRSDEKHCFMVYCGGYH